MDMQKISLEDTNTNDAPNGQSEAVKTPGTGRKINPKTVRLGVAVVLGLVVGVMAAQYQIRGSQEAGVDSSLQAAPTSKEQIVEGQTFGSANESTFRDSAEGVVQEGGIEGEGSHHIIRPGGVDQTVYITSSVVDLDLFVGHKVKVWGETFAAKKAGWLMDVGRVKVLELNAQLPE